MRKEITASRQYSAKCLHKQFRTHRLLAGDVVEVPLQCKNHAYDERRSRATLLESYISLCNSWKESNSSTIRNHIRDVKYQICLPPWTKYSYSTLSSSHVSKPGFNGSGRVHVLLKVICLPSVADCMKDSMISRT